MAVKDECWCHCGVWMSCRLISKCWTNTLFSLWSLQETDRWKKKTKPPPFTKEDQSNWTTLIFFFPLPFYTCVYINISKKLFTLLFPLRLSGRVLHSWRGWDVWNDEKPPGGWHADAGREGLQVACSSFGQGSHWDDSVPDSQLGWLMTMARWCSEGRHSQWMFTAQNANKLIAPALRSPSDGGEKRKKEKKRGSCRFSSLLCALVTG